MKKLLLLAVVGMLSINVNAQIKCERSPSGGTCCWDIRTDGPFRPIGC